MEKDASHSAPKQIPAEHAFLWGVVLEGGLALVGIVLAWALGLPHPLQYIAWSWEAVFWGVVGTLPAILWMALVIRIPLRFCREILEFLNVHFLPILRQWSLPQILLVSVLAGFGEEVLFRGVIQVAFQRGGTTLFHQVTGVIGGALLFGLLHTITPGYVLFATGMGVYLGLLYLWTDNLLVPILSHALYDFVICLYLVRRLR